MRSITFLSAVAILIFPCAASLAMDRAELMVGMKTLPLLNTKITGDIKIAVLYDPASNASLQDARAVKSMIDGGLDLPDLNAESVMVPANELGKMAGSRIAVISPGLSSFYDAINTAAAADRVLTLSTDLACVRENKCIIGIVSKPRVEIYYSKIAAENAQITFEQAFTMLVKPVSD